MTAPYSKRHLDQKAVYLALTDDATFGTVLHAICITAYGEEIYQLDPVELYVRLEEDFGGRITEDNESKLQAIITLITTDAFYEDPDAFRAICNTLTEGDPGLGLVDDLTVPEIMWGLYEVELNRDPGAMSPAVEALIAREVESEWTDDQEEEGRDYVFNFLSERRRDLHNQLEAVGYEINALPPIRAALPA